MYFEPDGNRHAPSFTYHCKTSIPTLKRQL
jgi:hypothetical protein